MFTPTQEIKFSGAIPRTMKLKLPGKKINKSELRQPMVVTGLNVSSSALPTDSKNEFRHVGYTYYRNLQTRLWGRTRAIGMKAYANPPWNLIGRVLTQTRQQHCPRVTGMEGTVVVPSAAGNAGAHSTLDSPKEKPDHSHTQGQPFRGSSSASHVDSIQQHYKECFMSYKTALGIMETEVFQDIWLTVSESGQLVWWTGQFSCPIGEVINFLAHLFKQGYHQLLLLGNFIRAWEDRQLWSGPKPDIV